MTDLILGAASVIVGCAGMIAAGWVHRKRRVKLKYNSEFAV